MANPEEERLKIAYITTYDPEDVRHWSGTGYFIWRSLSQCGVDVKLVGPLQLPSGVQRFLGLKQRFYNKVRRKVYLPDHDVMAARAYAQEAWKRLQNLKGIQAVVSPGTIPVAFLPGNLPLLTISDVTHKLLFQSYHIYENLCGANHRDGDRIERAAVRRASALIFASQWAADGAIRDYGAPPEKVHVVPFGANFVTRPSRQDALAAIDARSFDTVRLLFMGVDWVRKGGQVALETVRTLVKKGVPAHLTVIGCEPVIPAEDAGNVTVRGFITKTAEGQREIEGYLKQSHFLIVPSEAECYGLVYCEASAFGVPSMARNVGGVGAIIRNEINGRLFEPQQSANDMADWIVKFFSNPEDYRRLARSSQAEFETRLNWEVAGGRLKTVLEDIIANTNTQRA